MTAHLRAVRRLMSGDRIVSCLVGRDEYVLRGSDVRVIVRAEQMRRGPDADGTVGTLAIGDDTVPVYRLATALGIGAATRPPGGGHIVVTVGPGGMIGWLVDKLMPSQVPGAAHLLALPAMVGARATRWFEGLLTLDDRSLLLVSPATLDPRVHPQSASAWGIEAPAAAPASPPAADDVSKMIVMFASPGLPRLDTYRYALSARQIAAAVQSLPVIAVPGSAPHVIGVASWHDDVLPVVDFRSEGERRDAREQTRYLVVRGGRRLHGIPVAFPVDPDVRLYQPAPGDRQVVGLTPNPRFVTGVFSAAGEPVALLDLDALLALEQPECADQVLQ